MPSLCILSIYTSKKTAKCVSFCTSRNWYVYKMTIKGRLFFGTLNIPVLSINLCLKRRLKECFCTLIWYRYTSKKRTKSISFCTQRNWNKYMFKKCLKRQQKDHFEGYK